MRVPALGRLLPAAAAVAALVLAPSAAAAAPSGAPKQVTNTASSFAHGEFVLPDGGVGQVGLGEFRYGVPGEWLGQLDVRVPGGASGYALLTDEQVDFHPSLGGAVARDVPVTVSTYTWGPDGYGRTDEQVTVSVVFTGTGRTDRHTYHGDTCGDGSPGCKGLRTSAVRAADVVVTIDGVASTGTGAISRGFGIDVGTPEGGEYGG